jgi:sulfite exporter TauE/SafE
VDQESLLINMLATGLAHCRAVTVEHGGLLTSLFMAGLVGSATHCVGMCGPFVLAQTVARLESRPASDMREFHRLSGAALVPYHLGRATTYAGLGAAAALLAGGVIDVTGLKWLSAALLILAALFFLGYAVQRIGVHVPWLRSGGESGWSRHLGRWARPLFERPVGVRGYALGLMLGFLPCGLLYGALAAAAASGDPLSGAFAMIAFALGTVPALLAVGLAGHVAGRRWQGLLAGITPVLMVFNAAALTYLAWRVVA